MYDLHHLCEEGISTSFNHCYLGVAAQTFVKVNKTNRFPVTTSMSLRHLHLYNSLITMAVNIPSDWTDSPNSSAILYYLPVNHSILHRAPRPKLWRNTTSHTAMEAIRMLVHVPGGYPANLDFWEILSAPSSSYFINKFYWKQINLPTSFNFQAHHLLHPWNQGILSCFSFRWIRPP